MNIPFSTTPGMEFMSCSIFFAFVIFMSQSRRKFPLSETTGPTFSATGHLTPTAWAKDGFQNILLRGQGFDSILLPAGLLLVYAAVFFAAAIWRFKTE